jgi:hypothetical protein
MVKSAVSSKRIPPGAVVLSSLVREYKARGVELISVQGLEEDLKRLNMYDDRY